MVNFSIVIATYNGEDYITDALESILAQTYKPTEVIITDDGSTNDIIQVCKNWLNVHPDFCKRVKIITVPKNTGAVSNYIRGFNAVSDDCNWIKILDGDDMLTPDSLLQYKNYIESHPDTKVISAAIICFENSDDITGTDTSKFSETKVAKKLQDKSVETQLDYFNYFGMFTLTPTLAFRNEVIKEVPYDARIPMIADYPFNENLLNKGIRIDYISAATAFYRLTDSISHSSKNFYNPLFMQSMNCYRQYYSHHIPLTLLGLLVRIRNGWSRLSKHIFYVTLSNRPESWSSSFFRINNIFMGKYNQLLLLIYYKFYLK